MIESEISNLVIGNVPLKQFLQLFESSDPLHVIELGDTWHPSSGYVDKKIIEGCKTVQGLIDFDYDFKGLVIFEANIGDYKIYYSDSANYKLTASKKNIEKLFRKIEAFNMRSDGVKFEIISKD